MDANNELAKMSKKELQQKCQELGIVNFKSKNKSKIIELINECEIMNLHATDHQETFSLKPIIKWSGGKSDEIKQFVKYLPNNYDTYIEPFIGGGSVYFHLAPKKAVINDVYK